MAGNPEAGILWVIATADRDALQHAQGSIPPQVVHCLISNLGCRAYDHILPHCLRS